MAWWRRSAKGGGAKGEGGSLRRALAQVLAEDWEAAELTLSGMVQADSRDTESYLALAQLYRRRGEVGRAIRVHQNLLLREGAARATRIQLLLELARDFTVGGFADRAIASYDEILSLDSKNIEAKKELLALLVAEGAHERALSVRRSLGRRKGGAGAREEADLLQRMALAARAEGESAKARKLVKQALRRCAEHSDAAYLLAELEVERNRTRSALAIWRDLMERGGPEATMAYVKAESGYVALRQSQRYEAFLRGLTERRPADPEPRLALGRSLAGRGEIDDAVVVLRQLLDHAPTCLRARLALGEIYLAEHRDSDALKEFGELIGFLATTSPDRLESGE